jgi:hypothetical protein
MGPSTPHPGRMRQTCNKNTVHRETTESHLSATRQRNFIAPNLRNYSNNTQRGHAAQHCTCRGSLFLPSDPMLLGSLFLEEGRGRRTMRIDVAAHCSYLRDTPVKAISGSLDKLLSIQSDSPPYNTPACKQPLSLSFPGALETFFRPHLPRKGLDAFKNGSPCASDGRALFLVSFAMSSVHPLGKANRLHLFQSTTPHERKRSLRDWSGTACNVLRYFYFYFWRARS